MKRSATSPIRPSHSGVPAFAAALAAMAFVCAGAAYNVGALQARDTVRPIIVNQEKSRRDLEPLAIETSASPERLAMDTPAIEALSAPVEVGSADFIPVDPAPAELPDGPRIVLVIDDVGLDVAAARRVMDLPVTANLAILPYADAAASLASEAQARGLDVLVHMPMEPLGLADPGPNALRLGLSASDLAVRARWAMARIPGAIGFNNHMGSRFTQDPAALRQAMSAIVRDDLVFLDSRTSAQSRGGAVARGLGLDVLERDVFLDHVVEAEAIQARLDEAEALARRRGFAVVIGHPHDVTLTQLEDWAQAATERGLVFVTIRDMLADQARVETVQASTAQ